MADLLEKEKDSDVYQSPVKFFSLFILEIFFAFLMSFYFRQLGASFSAGNLIWFLASFCLFVVFSFFSALFMNEILWSSLAAGLAVLAGLAVFYDQFGTPLVIFGLLVFFVLFLGIRELRGQLDNALKISFPNLVKSFLPKISLAMAVLTTLFVYLLFFTRAGFPISSDNFKFIFLKPEEKLVGLFINNFNFDKPLEAILSDVFEKQLLAQIPNFYQLPAATQQAGLETVKAQEQNFIGSIDKSLGLKINAKETVDQVIYDSLSVKFNQLGGTAQRLIVIGILVLIFFSIQFLLVILNWLLFPVLFIVYTLLLTLKFARIKLEPRSKEVFVV